MSSYLNEFQRHLTHANFLILDTETTGLDRHSEICEIAVINHVGHTLLNTLVQTSHPIPHEATHIHGITNAMVYGNPNWTQIQPQLRHILHSKHVVIYNAKYDRRLMHQSDEAWQLETVAYKEEANYWCAMRAYAEYHGERNATKHGYKWQTLTNAAATMNVNVATLSHHRALDDCLMTLEVVKAILHAT